ncbi:PLAC8 motif-containing protein [Tanacetum coccineum]
MHSSTATPPQYATRVPAHQMTIAGEWSTGLCDCTKDMSSCCLTCWCPCITFGQIAEVVDKGTTLPLLPNEPCHDCIIHWCCEPCALCQEYYELRNRGFDLYFGWNGNMARQNHGVVITPIPPAEMKR